MTATPACKQPRPASEHTNALLSGFAVAISLVALHQLGRGALGAPPLRSGAELSHWVDSRSPVVAGLALARLVALVLGYHLAITGIIAWLGRAVGSLRLIAMADRATLPPFRSAWRRAAGLTLSGAALVTGPLARAGATPRPQPIVLERLADVAPGSPTSTVTLVRLDDAEAIGHPASGGRPASSDAVLEVVPETVAHTAGEADEVKHVVEPGDHLWGLAEQRMSEHLDRPATDHEVAPYWRAVLVANGQLRDPDLLFPGQVVVLPGLPVSSSPDGAG